MSSSSLPLPHGGTLVNLMATGPGSQELTSQAQKTLPSIVLTPRQTCDLELLMNGGFSPLKGFMNEQTYLSVVKDMRLPNGLLWPMPIVLDVTSAQVESLGIEIGKQISLKDEDSMALAILTVESKWIPDKKFEALHVFGSEDDTCHPSIDYLHNQAGDVYLGGSIVGLRTPSHYDFVELRFSPRELREKIEKLFWKRVVAFQTRNPMHRSHRELTLRAAKQAKANILLHPVVGMTKPGDVDHYTRVRCYLEILKSYPTNMATLALLPLAMRMAGPREALWHSLIRKNFGATHFIIGRDHAGPGNNKNGVSFYEPFAAQQLVKKFQEEIGIQILMFQECVYVEDMGDYMLTDEVPPGSRVLNISGTELRRRLNKGIPIPDWFTYPGVAKILKQTYPPKSQQGFTVFFTGLSGAGKSTLAKALMIALLQDGARPVTLLDGDEVRQNLSSELGFSKRERDLNIRRIGYVAGVITKARGTAIISAIAPYENIRQQVREEVSKHGGFVLVHVNTGLEVCEQRDIKNLYAKARSGMLKNFTGVDDPYEVPKKPEIVIDTGKSSVTEGLHEILLFLESEGYLARSSSN